MNHWIKMSLLNKRWNIEYKMTIGEQKFESLNKIGVYWTKNRQIEYRMTITEKKYELLNINCMLLNIATIRQPYIIICDGDLILAYYWQKQLFGKLQVCTWVFHLIVSAFSCLACQCLNNFINWVLHVLSIYVTLHRILGIKVNARAWQNGTLDNRQWAKWHASVRALSQMGHLIKDCAFVFITRVIQSREFGQTKECAEFKKTKRPCKMAQRRVK